MKYASTKRAIAKYEKTHTKVIGLKYFTSEFWKIEKLKKIADKKGVAISRLFKDETEKLLDLPEYKDL